MTKHIEIEHDGMNHGVQLYNNEIVFYRVDIDDSGFVTWGEDSTYYNYTITNDVQRSFVLFRKIAKAVQEIVYSESKHYYTFNVSDQKRKSIYRKFAETLDGYQLVHEAEFFYLYKQ